MLTDADKVDLIRYISDSMAMSRTACTREKLVAASHRGILHYIIGHPDVCAAEIDDFFCLGTEAFIQEYNRLERKGIL